MNPSVVDQPFLDNLRNSGIFDDAGFAQLMQQLYETGLSDADPSSIAGWLVQQGVLTRFQAEQLLEGKFRNFLINRKYLILEPLGSGGMGAVYRCRHLLLSKDVALKVLPTSLTSDPAALQRFLREARALAALNHPNIVQAHDCDESQGRYFLVMGCVEGINLQQLVEQQGPLPVAQAANYIAQACLGLQHAYEAGWVHRDLKPGNLLVDRQDTIKVLDLGLARMMDDSAESITRKHDAESMIGSPDYISPEQSLNSPDIDIRSDIYSLGATLHYLLAGKSPFEGLPLMQKLLAHQLKAPPDLRHLRRDVPAELADVVQRMMAKAPHERYATPAEVAEALQPWSSQYAIQAARGSRAVSTGSRSPVDRSSVPPAAGAEDSLFPRMTPSGNRADANVHYYPAAQRETARPTAHATLSIPPAIQPPRPPGEEYAEPAHPDKHSSGRTMVLIVGGIALALGLAAFAVWGGVSYFGGDHAAKKEETRHPVQQAEDLCRAKRWQEAANLYARLLTEAGVNSKRHGEILAHIRVKGREEVLPTLAVILPEDFHLQFYTGFYHIEQKEYAKALEYFSRIASHPNARTSTWYNRAICEIHLGQHEAALASLDQAAKLTPGDAQYVGGAMMIEAWLQRETEGRQRCQTFLPRMQKVTEDTDRLTFCLACGLYTLDRRDLETVLEHARKLVEKNPRYGRHQFALGLVQFRLGRFREALECFETADKTTQTWSGRMAMEPARALVLQRLGRWDEAKLVLQKLDSWRTQAQAKLPKNEFCYLTISGDVYLLECLRREAERTVRLGTRQSPGHADDFQKVRTNPLT